MKKIILLLALIVCSCSPKIIQATTDTTRDSVRIEYRERIVRDTAYVEIPLIREVNVTRDTASRLENNYAKSEAVVSDGMLSHSLETKPQSVPAPMAVTIRDTIIVREKAQTIIEQKIVEVEKQLTKAQRRQIAGFWVLLFVMLLFVAWKIYRLFR